MRILVLDWDQTFTPTNFWGLGLGWVYIPNTQKFLKIDKPKKVKKNKIRKKSSSVKSGMKIFKECEKFYEVFETQKRLGPKN